MNIKLFVTGILISFGAQLCAADLSNPFIENVPTLPGAITINDISHTADQALQSLGRTGGKFLEETVPTQIEAIKQRAPEAIHYLQSRGQMIKDRLSEGLEGSY